MPTPPVPASTSSNTIPPQRPGGTGIVGPVLVSGVCGFIGSHLALTLLQQGASVIGVDTRPLNACTRTAAQLRRLHDHSGFRLLTASVDDPEVAGILGGVAAVIHLAAATDVAASWGAGFSAHAASVLATQRLLDACSRQRVRRVVIASSSHVYGPACGGVAREDQPVEPTSPYGVAKLAAERLALAYARRPGSALSAVALRFFTAFGPGCNPAMVVPRLFTTALEGTTMPLFGDGNAVHTWTYVDDLVDASIRAAAVAMDAGDAAVINAAGADRASLLQVADIVGEITGRPGRLEPAGERAGDAVGTRADLRRARDLLGFTPRVPLREGLLRLWRQMPQGPVPEAETSTTAA